jgi:Mce-associated membrane protein
MTSSPNPTWYDILGVDRDATPDQIKTAWRAATDKFEPGSGTSQFRLFNEAADVLLDPAKRKAYDAGLGVPDGMVDAAGPVADPADTEESELADPEAEEPAPLTTTAAEPEDAPDAVADTTALTVPEGTPDAPPASAERDTSKVVGWLGDRFVWITVVCVPVLVASIVAALVAVFGLHVWGADVEGLAPTVRTFDAGPDASAAAERALKAVLSYDYRHMEADRDRAVEFLTPAYKKDYLKTFNELLAQGPDGSPGPVEKTKAVVTADVLDTGVVDAESDRVRIIAFVNQSSVKGDGQPTVFQNRVVATMVHRGDRWLVDNLKSY